MTESWMTDSQVAGLLTAGGWLMHDVAYGMGGGTVTPDRVDSLAEKLEKVAGLLRQHAAAMRQPPGPIPQVPSAQKKEGA